MRPGSARLAFDSHALEVIGVLKYVARARGLHVLPAQQPADRVLGQKWLKHAGWHLPGHPHADDAAAHLLTWRIVTGRTAGRLDGVIRHVLGEREDEGM